MQKIKGRRSQGTRATFSKDIESAKKAAQNKNISRFINTCKKKQRWLCITNETARIIRRTSWVDSQWKYSRF